MLWSVEVRSSGERECQVRLGEGCDDRGGGGGEVGSDHFRSQVRAAIVSQSGNFRDDGEGIICI